ncbi:VirD4-like conjugal transfer protein, CD1115 family [Bacillus cereus]|uniref:VirD4-like conjugal transfer protein, CD1115 family n=1 Tax=Bacillus cereus TaxID=1396 RepID=UPI001F487C32|nr:type IV secretory system conjugative DNA transfer family protein [Bacillus cereus]BCD32902.1 hypothetical protein BC30102_p331 [Bacillus cereus]
MIDKREIGKSALKTTPFLIGMDYMGALATNMLPVLPKAIKDLDHLDMYQNQMMQYLMDPALNISQAIQNEYFLKGQLALLGLGAFITLKNAWGNRKKHFEDASVYGSHGTARFSTKQEIFDRSIMVGKYGTNGLYLGMYDKKPVIHKKGTKYNRNVAVFGGTGSYKTAGLVIQNILESEDSVVVIDPKTELYRLTSKKMKEKGFDIKVINFMETAHSSRYNPFDYIREDLDARRVAMTLVMNSTEGGQSEESFWDKAEVSLLSTIFLYIKYKFVDQPDLRHLGSVMNILLSSYDAMEKLFKEFPYEHIVNVSYRKALEKLNDKTRDNVFISLSVTMDLWTYTEVCEFTCKSDFTFEELVKKKTILYVVIPIAQEEFRPLIATFFSQMFAEFYRIGNKNGGELPIPIRVILDEFNNIGRLVKFGERLSTTRSYLIEVMMIIQDLSQLRDRWGKNKANELIANCDSLMFLGTNELEAAQYFSKLLDKTTVRVQTTSASVNRGGEGSSESYQVTSRDLMTAGELLRLAPDKMILFMRGRFPSMLNKVGWFENKHFKPMIQEKADLYKHTFEERTEYRVFRVINEKEREEKKEEKIEKISIQKQQDIDDMFIS